MTAGFPDAQASHVETYLRKALEVANRVGMEHEAPPELLGSLVVACVLDLHMTELRKELEAGLAALAQR